MKWLAFGPAIIFAIVGGLMNFSFATGLGTDELTTRCWQALSIGATLYTVLGCDLAQRALRSREWAKAGAAGAILALSLCYDGLAAYGFAARQHAATTNAASEQIRRHSQAQSDVTETAAELAKYSDALDPQIAADAQRSLTDQIATLDRMPGVMDKDGPCVTPQRPVTRELCAQRSTLSEQLRTAQSQRVRAETRARLQSRLDEARTRLNSAPLPPPADPRADLMGNTFIEWLPVALLTVGALFGMFAASVPAATERPARDDFPFPTASPSPTTTELPITPATQLPGASDPPVPSATASQPGLTLPSVPANQVKLKPGADKLARRIAELTSDAVLPVGLTLDQSGWLRGSQRALARATGIKTTSAFHRAMHESADSGQIEIDTTGRETAIRVSS